MKLLVWSPEVFCWMRTHIRGRGHLHVTHPLPAFYYQSHMFVDVLPLVDRVCLEKSTLLNGLCINSNNTAYFH